MSLLEISQDISDTTENFVPFILGSLLKLKYRNLALNLVKDFLAAINFTFNFKQLSLTLL